MGEEKIILTLHFPGVKSEPRTARLYRITSKSSMGEEKYNSDASLPVRKIGAAHGAVYHGIQKNTMAAAGKMRNPAGICENAAAVYTKCQNIRGTSRRFGENAA